MKQILLVLVLIVLAGCGFRLRGSATVPFETLYIPQSKSGIGLALKRNIEANTSAKVIDDPRKAQALLAIAQEARGKQILSLTGAGRVNEFKLTYTINFRVHDGKGGDYVPPSIIELQREMTYSDAQILAKEAEEQLLFRDMQSQAVQVMLRRIAAAQPAKPSVQ
ncbi:MAG TPA: LPS assembly lipoprotein LptE [Burkholderiales bacterium]